MRRKDTYTTFVLKLREASSESESTFFEAVDSELVARRSQIIKKK